MNQKKRAELEVVMERIRKLLALGSSPNEHEAALASSKAQELLEKYDLTMESIDDLRSDSRTAIRSGESVVSTTEGKPDGWKADLFQVVALSSDCFTVYVNEYEKTPSGRYRTVRHGKLIGFGHDVEMAGYVLNFLVQEITRLAQQYADAMWEDIAALAEDKNITHSDAESLYVRRHGRHPLKAKLYFIKGATETVCYMLADEYNQRRDNRNPYAMVLDKRSAIRDHIYLERHGKTYDEYNAQFASTTPSPSPSSSLKGQVETVEEQTARLNREDRQREKWYREQAKRDAATDHAAVQAGRKAGHDIRVHKGLTDGPERKGQID